MELSFRPQRVVRDTLSLTVLSILTIYHHVCHVTAEFDGEQRTKKAANNTVINVAALYPSMHTMAVSSPASSSPSSKAMVALPRIGLGMAALGRPGYINLDRTAIFGSDGRTVDRMQSQANVVMDRLFELTTTAAAAAAAAASTHAEKQQRPWLDCARSYGLSEKFVGEYLRRRRVDPSNVYVSSKWGYTYVADWNVQLPEGANHEIKDHSTANFLKQLEETVEYVGEYLDLYQIHSATFESGILTDRTAHEALARCRKDRGWSIGLSLSSPKQDEILRAAMSIRVDGGTPLFDSVQCTYNVLEQKPAAALQEARDAGLDIIIKEGLANGRALRHPEIRKYASQLSCEPDQLALACILAQPFAPRVLSGAVTPEQLKSNWKALEVSERLQERPDLLKEIMDACAMNSQEYWDERAALAWN